MMLVDTKKYLLSRPPHVEVKQLHQHLPFFNLFYTDYEKNYDVVPLLDWSRTVWPALPLFLVIVYIIAIFTGKKIMESREVSVATVKLILGEKRGKGKRE